MIGQRLGHYRVDERIGAGGMGVVYRAYDTRLQRPVAIKFVDDQVVSGEAAHRQLLSEAQTASALNHPNICTVHDVGEAGDRIFLVMEFVEGARLDALIPAGGMAGDAVVRHGQALADALDHAHGRGVLHRDLKSANVIVTPGGTAKVLDFGIARRIPAGTADDTRLATSSGARHVTGTFAYLAPEVLAGRPASVQSDIWSLGILLYEMASGSLPFAGGSVFELTAAILREPAPPLPDTVPPALCAVIRRCLDKEPAQRYPRAGEVRAALEAVSSQAIGSLQATPSRARSRWIVAALVAGVVVVAALPWTRALFLRRPPPAGTGAPHAPRLALLLSSDRRMLDPSVSPDGRLIAYVAEVESGPHDLFVSQVSGEGRLRLTNDAAVEGWPRFSPDGQRISFTRREAGVSSICLVPAIGGTVTTVLTGAAEAAWSPDGTRLAFTERPESNRTPALATARSDGSDIRTLYTAASSQPFIRSPAWSPDGKQIAFVMGTGGAASGVWLIPPDGGTPRPLSGDAVGAFSAEPVFSPDNRAVVLSSNRGGATNLWSVPLDGGPPAQLTSGPGPDVSPSIAGDGLITFLNSRWRSALTVADVDRGTQQTLLTHAPYLWAPTVSPDGSRIAFSRAETNGLWHLWLMPAAGGTARQLTFGGTGEIYPRFTPDGRAIVFHTWAAPHRLWEVSLDGGPPKAITPEGAADEGWADVSPDGRLLAFVRVLQGIEYIFITPRAGGDPKRLTSGPSTLPRWSPDGTHLVFSRDRSFDGGIWIIDATGRNERQLSMGGGWPVWWPDGSRVAFLALDMRGDQEVRLVDLSGRPLPARQWPRFVGTNQVFDVLPGGSAIVTALAVHQSDEIWMLRR